MRPRRRELIPMATYSVTERPEVVVDPAVCAFGANWTSVISVNGTQLVKSVCIVQKGC